MGRHLLSGGEQKTILCPFRATVDDAHVTSYYALRLDTPHMHQIDARPFVHGGLNKIAGILLTGLPNAFSW